MDHRSEVREFLSTRRARLTPERAGLPAWSAGGHRRVPGLRREEVALLAGVSVDYYTRLERGDLSGASDSVLDALARGLQLDEAETAHLFDLARTANASPGARRPRAKTDAVRPSIQRLLDAMTDAPAILRNNYFDYVAANALGRALYSPVFGDPAPNSARFAFLDPAARDFYPEWDKNTQDLVATMRGEAGRNPFDRRLTDLMGELSTRSERFRTLWAAHNVRYHRSGVKRRLHAVDEFGAVTAANSKRLHPRSEEAAPNAQLRALVFVSLRVDHPDTRGPYRDVVDVRSRAADATVVHDAESVGDVGEPFRHELLADRSALPRLRALRIVRQCEDQPAELRMLTADPLLTGIPASLVLSARGRTGFAAHDFDRGRLDCRFVALHAPNRLSSPLVDGLGTRTVRAAAQPTASGVAQLHAFVVGTEFQRHVPAPSVGPGRPSDRRRSCSSASSIHSRAREA